MQIMQNMHNMQCIYLTYLKLLEVASTNLLPCAQDVVSSSFPTVHPALHLIPQRQVFSITAGTAGGKKRETQSTKK